MRARLFTKISAVKKPILQEARGQWKAAHYVFTAWTKIERPLVLKPAVTQGMMHWSLGISMMQMGALHRSLQRRRALNCGPTLS